MNTEKLRRYKDLTLRRRRLQAMERKIKGQLDQLDEELQEEFLEAGVSSMKLNGATVYLHRQLWPSVDPEKRQELIDALERMELRHLVTLHWQSLAGYVREFEPETLPPDLQGLIGIEERISLRVRQT